MVGREEDSVPRIYRGLVLQRRHARGGEGAARCTGYLNFQQRVAPSLSLIPDPTKPECMLVRHAGDLFPRKKNLSSLFLVAAFFGSRV